MEHLVLPSQAEGKNDALNGAFTKAISEALEGRTVAGSDGTTTKADFLKFDDNTSRYVTGEDGIISATELEQFLKVRVPGLVGEYWPSEVFVQIRDGVSEYMSLFIVEP